MDIPEARLLERDLQSLGLDAATALAVLLKTLGDDHLARVPGLEPIDDLADDYHPDDEKNARTALEWVHLILKRECRKNNDVAARHDRPGVPESSLPAPARAAGELTVAQDAVRDLVACCLDRMDVYESVLHARPAPAEPGEGGSVDGGGVAD